MSTLSVPLAQYWPQRSAQPPRRIPPAHAAETMAVLVDYQRKMMRIFYANRIYGDDAQELRQQACIIVIEKICADGLMRPERAGAYLYGTARRLSIEYWRLRLWRATLLTRLGEKAFRLPDTAPSPEELTNVEQQSQLVRRATAQLRPRDREILTRVYLREEPREAARASMHLDNNRVFNNVLFRAQQRFAEVALNAEGSDP
jgi:DNA-directed RNA polymerase specialized sigma24 family protein